MLIDDDTCGLSPSTGTPPSKNMGNLPTMPFTKVLISKFGHGLPKLFDFDGIANPNARVPNAEVEHLLANAWGTTILAHT